MSTMNTIKVGDKVSWKNGLHRGVVVEVFTSKRKGSAQLRSLIDAGCLPPLPHTMKAKVAEDGRTNGYWTIPCEHLKRLGAASSEQSHSAQHVVSSVAGNIRNAQAARKHNARDVARGKRLHLLQKGERILVEYRGGVSAEREFVRLTSGFNVEYLQEGRTRSTPPQFVSIPASTPAA